MAGAPLSEVPSVETKKKMRDGGSCESSWAVQKWEEISKYNDEGKVSASTKIAVASNGFIALERGLMQN